MSPASNLLLSPNYGCRSKTGAPHYDLEKTMDILAGAGDVGGAFAAVAEQVQASVVEVRPRSGGAGAGTIWRPDGTIVTNYHVAGTVSTARSWRWSKAVTAASNVRPSARRTRDRPRPPTR